jgi:hypothetical protein
MAGPPTAAKIGERSAGETDALGCGAEPNGCQWRADPGEFKNYAAVSIWNRPWQ